MHLTRISNLFNLLVQESDYFNSYHFGYGSDIQVNTPNNFNADGNGVKPFPHVTWVGPVDCSLDMTKGIFEAQIQMFFYGLQDYDETNNPTSAERTLLIQWSELLARAVEFIHAVKKVKGYSVKDGRVEIATDANVHIDRCLCVDARFTIQTAYTCTDYDSDPPLSENLPTLPVEATIDLEVP